MGRDTTGVKGIELRKDDAVIGMVVIQRDAALLVVTERGMGKCSPIDDYRVLADKLDERLQSYSPGQKVTLLIARRDELKRVSVTLGQEPADRWTLSIRPGATPEQRAHLASLITNR